MPLDIPAANDAPQLNKVSDFSENPLHQELGDIFGPGKGQEDFSRSSDNTASGSPSDQQLLPSLEIQEPTGNNPIGDTGAPGDRSSSSSSAEKATSTAQEAQSSQPVVRMPKDSADKRESQLSKGEGKKEPGAPRESLPQDLKIDLPPRPRQR